MLRYLQAIREHGSPEVEAGFRAMLTEMLFSAAEQSFMDSENYAAVVEGMSS